MATRLTYDVLDSLAGCFGITRDELTLVGELEKSVRAFAQDGQEAVWRLTHSLHRSIEQIEAELDSVK
ncbi:MAG TPA: hypothetical protein VF171_00295 [Trueperaceae bacterium]